MVETLHEFEYKTRLRKLLARVTKEASAFGLESEEIPADMPGYRRFRKRLKIAGYNCQVVSSRLRYVNGISGLHLVYPALMTRTDWADFVVLVIKDRAQPEELSFFIIPRGEIVKSTTVCSRENWLFQYRDAWSLLSQPISPVRLERRTEHFSWKLALVVAEAKKRGVEIDLLDKSRTNRPMQKRVLIYGRRCQLVAMARLSKDAESERWNYIILHPSKEAWAEFFIFILRTRNDHDIFIIPRERIPRSTTTALTSRWLNHYRDNWTLQTTVEPTAALANVSANLDPQRSRRPKRVWAKSPSRTLQRKRANAELRPTEPLIETGRIASPESIVDVNALLDEQLNNIRMFYAKR